MDAGRLRGLGFGAGVGIESIARLATIPSFLFRESSMSVPRPTLVLVFVTCLLMPSSPVRAELELGEGPERRVLGGHQFQPVERHHDPFVTTHLRTSTGAGIASGLESQFINTNGDTLGVLKGDLAFFVLNMEYQKNLFGRGAVRLAVSGTGRAGTSEQSMLAEGVSTVYGIVIQGKYLAYQTGRSRVSVLATVTRKNVFGIDPFGFAQHVIDNGGLSDDNSLVSEGSIHRFSIGTAGAHSFQTWMGSTAFVDFGLAQPIRDDADLEGIFRAGVAADFDLLPLKKIPLGFTLGYDYDSFPEGGADVAKGIHAGTLGINYTGRRDFHVGLDTVVSTLKQTDIDSTLAATTFLLSLRYYF